MQKKHTLLFFEILNVKIVTVKKFTVRDNKIFCGEYESNLYGELKYSR